MSIVVIEGPDGSGKTFLARRLEAAGYQYVHNGVPQPGEDLFVTYTNQLLEAAKRKTVFDRLHLGELVYGTVIRGKSLLTVEQIRLLNRLLHSLGGTTVFCMPSFSTIRGNWEARRGLEYVQGHEQLHLIYEGYHALQHAEYNGLNYSEYDYARDPINWVPWVPGFEPTARLFNRGVIGNPGARYLFVGEKAGPPHDLAFYSYERSSHYLNECLWEAGYTEAELAFTNAYRQNGKPRWIMTEKRPNTVVALGMLAQRQCEIQGVTHLKAPHPQYVKRFKSRERWRYVELLRSFRQEGK